MTNATVSVTQGPTTVDWGYMSERIEARLSRCLVRRESVLEQRNGRSHTVPAPITLTPLRAHPAESILRLPGLNGRSVRRLQHLRAVRSLRRALISSAAAVAVIVTASVGVPAYAEASAEAAAATLSPLQVFTVAPLATSLSVERDGYTFTPPPPVQWPTALHTKISDGFGPRASPCDGCSSVHPGVDILAGRGAEVHAVAAGVVLDMPVAAHASLGNAIMLQHEIDGQMVTSIYGHMQNGSTSLNPGDTVKVGQVIGLVGSTGAATGPHLHFEIRIGGSPVNPMAWLRARIA